MFGNLADAQGREAAPCRLADQRLGERMLAGLGEACGEHQRFG